MTHVDAINGQFNYSSAIHPYYGFYYSRPAVYKKMGFNAFHYLGSHYKITNQTKIGNNPYLSDKTAYKNTLNQINKQNGGQFINLITMQNHMPYNNYYSNNEYTGKIKSGVMNTETELNAFSTYTKGVSYTDQAVKSFITSIDKINKPISVVFYGDHYPAIISTSYLSQYGLKMHETNFFIYSNKYSREHLHTKRLNSVKIAGTNDFTSLILKQTNSKVSPYAALLTAVQEKLPVITQQSIINNTAAGDTTEENYEFITQQQKTLKYNSLTKNQKNLLHDLQLVQYDLTKGNHYLENTKFMSTKK
ncbi:sulfatase-like hydrolase/transferase [Lapidilactobacillus mulanensis]|uniref:Sulfatase-like hydrolase/transferase n=1 Tax=Lapidilactobacillus mulanensis TaxID=2485999 RepID=A0ABW4DN83_9LACO|nr:sulfatase-like hydrolase/transferase [Lapidilactobacillus mulanensis]